MTIVTLTLRERLGVLKAIQEGRPYEPPQTLIRWPANISIWNGVIYLPNRSHEVIQ
jgi:hypothetical protein